MENYPKWCYCETCDGTGMVNPDNNMVVMSSPFSMENKIPCLWCKGSGFSTRVFRETNMNRFWMPKTHDDFVHKEDCRRYHQWYSDNYKNKGIRWSDLTPLLTTKEDDTDRFNNAGCFYEFHETTILDSHQSILRKMEYKFGKEQETKGHDIAECRWLVDEARYKLKTIFPKIKCSALKDYKKNMNDSFFPIDHLEDVFEIKRKELVEEYDEVMKRDIQIPYCWCFFNPF